MLVEPGHSATFEFRLPHRPVTPERASELVKRDFQVRIAECRRCWGQKLNSAARIRLPERRVQEMVQAGLLHLDLISYGLEPDDTIAPMIGIYSPIGSESAPIIQFMDSVGWHKTAERALRYFLDKQHEDGFIQNFGGYMLETEAALWSLGEHFRYTGDLEWARSVTPKVVKACNYVIGHRRASQREELPGEGYGLLEGKVADPEDAYRIFMLNGYAYLGLSRAAEMLADVEREQSIRIAGEADSLKQNIRTAFFDAVTRSPVVPLGDGTWSPSAPPWVGQRGPVCLFAEGGKWHTHGTMLARDSLLGPMWLVFQEVLDANEDVTEILLNYHSELMCSRNVAFSQPYYSPHPWVHLRRGEVKRFLKAYYNGFAGLADRETYSFWEHYFHASPHKTHEEGWFLMQTRWMLYMERERTLKLLPGIPRAWLEDGRYIDITNIATYFGPMSLSLQSRLEQGYVDAKIVCRSARHPARLELRVPHPDGRRAERVSVGAYDPKSETVIIEPFAGEVELRVDFA